MKKKYLFFSLFLLALGAHNLFAQQRIVEGTVKSSLNKQPVAFATVIVEEDNVEIYADIQGRFRVEVSDNATKIAVGSSGFLAKEVAIYKESQYTVLEVLLEENELELKAQVVTANRVEENAQTTPVASTIIQSMNLQNRSVNQTNEALAITPNLVADAWNPGRINYSLRGMSTIFADPGVESAIGFYIDDVYYSRGFGFNSLLMDIDRVEVLRGPQGTLFGKNTVGGLINIISEKPKMANSAGGDIGVGNLGFFQIRAKGNVMLVNNKLAMRFTAAHSRRNGFIQQDNPIADGKNKTSFSGGRASFLFTPNRKMTFDANVFYCQDDGMETSLLLLNHKNAKLDSSLKATGVIRPLIERVSNTDVAATFNRKQFGASVRGQFNIGKNMLNTVTSYFNEKDFTFNDIDGTPRNSATTGRTQSLGSFSQEIRFSSPRNQRWSYIVGAHLIAEKIGNRDSLVLGSDFLSDFTSRTIPSGSWEQRYNGGGYVDNLNMALFTSHAVEIAKKLHLNIGARGLFETKTLNYFQNPLAFTGDSAASTNFVNTLPFKGNMITGLVAKPFAREDSMHVLTKSYPGITGNAGLDYQLNDNVLLYGVYSRGFKGASFNMVYSINPNDSTLFYKPESVNNYELGFKSQINNRYRINGNVFMTDFFNKQELLIEGTRLFIANAKHVRGWGVELEGNAILAKGLVANYSFAKLIMKYQEFITTKVVKNPQTGLNEVVPDTLSGKRVIKSPDYTAAVGLEYATNIADKFRVLTRVDWNYTGFAYNDIRNNPFLARMPANILNARLSFSDKTSRYIFSIWGKNLTNAIIVQHGWEYPGSRIVAVNPGRTFGVELRVNMY
ncbi:MAG: TonB-dependent receptor [Bacteroidia bacterium]